MGEYKDYIPNEAFLIKPKYERHGVTWGHTRTYFKKFDIFNFNDSYIVQKTKNTTNPIKDDTPDHFQKYEYNKGDKVIGDAGVIYKATTHVPKYKGLWDTDENGIPYWVEISTQRGLEPFDASSKTSLKSQTNGIIIRVPVGTVKTLFTEPPKNENESIAIMGIKEFLPNSENRSEKMIAFVHIYFKEPMEAIRANKDSNFAHNYRALTIDEFEIDLNYRDRICFKLPNVATIQISQNVQGIPLADEEDVMCDIYIQSYKPKTGGMPPSTLLGDIVSKVATDNKVEIGLIVTGDIMPMGQTLLGLDIGRSTTRENEANFLKRRVVKNVIETFKCEILLDSVEDHLKADYFFRTASETSHIIHAGTPEYDWKFVFGVLDGNAPVNTRTVNTMNINGAGVAFASTDPLKTTEHNEGWR